MQGMFKPRSLRFASTIAAISFKRGQNVAEARIEPSDNLVAGIHRHGTHERAGQDGLAGLESNAEFTQLVGQPGHCGDRIAQHG